MEKVETNREFFEELKQKYIFLKEKYADSFDELYAIVLSKAYRSEYAKGGEVLHRGFYSPSSADLVIGRSKRGRLLKHTPKTNMFNYEYIYDINNQMICVKKFSNDFKEGFCLYMVEILLNENTHTTGLTYNVRDTKSLEYISNCYYVNDVLLQYEFAVLGISTNDCHSIKIEKSEYNNNQMYAIDMYEYFPSQYLRLCGGEWSEPLLNHDRYVFDRDKEGFLSTYIRISMSDERVYSVTSVHKQNVLVKRK